MAFTVEDGTGLVNANSNVSVSDADTLLQDRGEPSAWAVASNSEKECDLIKATDYLNSWRRFPYRGTRLKANQGCAFPRTGCFPHGADEALPSDEVPAAIKLATALVAALIRSGTDLQPVLERGGQVIREKVGPIETEYAKGAPAEDQIIEALDAVSALVRTGKVYAPTPYLAQAATADEFKSGTYENPERSE